jgi:hypothetical protein
LAENQTLFANQIKVGSPFIPKPNTTNGFECAL